jgi:hypothetical protein
MVGLDIRLKKVDRVYVPGEMLSGVIVIDTDSSVSHNGIQINILGVVTLQLSSKR